MIERKGNTRCSSCDGVRVTVGKAERRRFDRAHACEVERRGHAM